MKKIIFMAALLSAVMAQYNAPSCETTPECDTGNCCGLATPQVSRYGYKHKVCRPDGSNFYMDYNGFRYDFVCDPKPVPIKPSDKGNKVPDEYAKVKGAIYLNLEPTAWMLFSDPQFYDALQIILYIMLGLSVVGTVAWPVWFICGLIIEGYNFIMFWTGLLKIMSVPPDAPNADELTFWNWLLFPARWAYVNSILFWLGNWFAIWPILGLIPTGLMWVNMNY